MTKKMAGTALGFSIAAVLTGPIPGGLFGIVALILAIIALVKMNKEKSKAGQGMAIAAIILSTVGVLIGWMIIGLLLYALRTAVSGG